jgi:hypothetical protein
MFGLEKENVKLKSDIKILNRVKSALTDEKEHLVQMLEIKNHILTQSTGGLSNGIMVGNYGN